MSDKIEADVESTLKIKKLSRLLQLIARLSFLLIPLGFGVTLWYLLVIGVPVPGSQQAPIKMTTEFSLLGRGLICFEHLFALAMSLLMVNQILRLANLFQGERFFVMESIHQFKILSNTVVIWILVAFLLSLFLPIIFDYTGDMPKTHSYLVELLSFDYIPFAVSLLFRIFAEIIEEGLRQKSDLELTI